MRRLTNIAIIAIQLSFGFFTEIGVGAPLHQADDPHTETDPMEATEPPHSHPEPPLIPSSPLPPPFPPTPGPPGDDTGSNEGLSGKDVYLKECAVCHGKEGEGTERGYQMRFPVSTYATAVTRAGRSGNRLFAIPMPAYPTEKISDQQLEEMWDYLRSFPRPTTGQELFTTYCANCHGKDGRGGFTGEGILGETGEYRKYIRKGKNRRYPLYRRKYMPAYTEDEISTEDILLLRQYARDLRQRIPRPQPRPAPAPGQRPRPVPHDHDDDHDDDHHHGKKPCHGHKKKPCHGHKHDDDDDDD